MPDEENRTHREIEVTLRTKDRRGAGERQVSAKIGPGDHGYVPTLGDEIATALQTIRPPRICKEVADLVISVFEGSGESHDFFPGHGKALDDLVDAAVRIGAGWKEHDRQMLKAACNQGGKQGLGQVK